MDLLLLALAALLLGALLATASRALARWRGGWRVLALGVVVGVLAWSAKIGIDLRLDPTSHNLWPFEVVGVALLALLALGMLALARPAARPVRA